MNRAPLGLQGLFDAKVNGVVPDDLSRVLTGTVEQTQLLLAGKLEVVQQLDATTTLGMFALITVPDTEVWFVHALSVSAVLTLAGAEVSLAPALAPNALAIGSGLYVALDNPTRGITLNNDEYISSGVRWPYPLVLGPGWVIGGDVSIVDLNGGGVTWYSQALVTRVHQ